MTKCFVIQPFDAGKYDKRYEDVYAPAIIAAGLEPYRVDKDPSTEIPIEAIEDGIRSAQICLADITTDNPNVWYELGYAFASGRQVVMVCSDERTGKKYPFDIQHRTIIPYQIESSRDFEVLKGAITTKIRALLKKTDALKTIRENEQVASVQGLSQMELAVLASVAGSVTLSDENVSIYAVKSEVERMGFTAIGFSLGLKRLREKNFLTVRQATDYNGEDYASTVVTPEAWAWIEKNQDKFIIQKPQRNNIADGEVPF